MELILFFLLGALVLGAAISVVAQPKAVYSALSLILCLCGLALLFVQLNAQFIAMIQIIVYAGAIMVLFLFVIMLLDPRSEVLPGSKVKYLAYIAVPLALAMALLLLQAFRYGETWPSNAPPTAAGTAEAIGELLFTKFLLPFEVTSILILVGILGAVILGKRKV
jgi:NADH-quinone oxidoreductase subunit J